MDERPVRYTRAFFAIAWVIFAAVAIVVTDVLKRRMVMLPPVWFEGAAGIAVCSTLIGVFLALPRTGRIAVTGDEVIVRRGDAIQRIPLRGARVVFSRWRPPISGGVGAAVVVDGPGGRLCVGSRDRYPEREDGPVVRRCSLDLDPASFDAFAAALAPWCEPGGAWPAPDPSARAVVFTQPRVPVWAPAAIFMVVSSEVFPRFAGSVGVLLSPTMTVLMVVLVVCVFVGVLTVAVTRPRTTRLLVSATRVRWIDPQARVVDDAARAEVRLAPAKAVETQTARGRTYRYVLTGLAMTFPSGRATCLVVRDFRFGWKVPAIESDAERFDVAPDAWRELVDAFGVAAYVDESTN